LYETNAVIQTMKDTLTALEPVLTEKSIAVDDLMTNLTKEQKQADKVRAVVKNDEEIAKVSLDHKQNKYCKYCGIGESRRYSSSGG
jgi:dynein heavy chain